MSFVKVLNAVLIITIYHTLLCKLTFLRELNRFYPQAVIQRPEVNISTPVKEFLAYGLDSSVSFVKKPLELQVPRLDKVRCLYHVL